MDSYQDSVEHGKALAAAVGRAVKKVWPGTTARLNYVGTGSKAHRRQVWLRCPDGYCVDVWLDGAQSTAQVGGVVGRQGVPRVVGVGSVGDYVVEEMRARGAAGGA
jgi:hypothetical protein